MSVKTTYEFNRIQSEFMSIDSRENAIDSLETALTFFGREDNLKWKWISIAIQHSLYHFCIANLEGSNYRQVISSGFDDDKDSYFKKGEEKWKKSKKVKRGLGYLIKWEEIEGTPIFDDIKKKKSNKDKVISFWTALARVQDAELYMNVYYECCNPLIINDEEWKEIEYLHEDLRNEFMHFVPVSKGIGISRIKTAISVALKCIEHLGLNTGQILYFDDEKSGKYYGHSEKRIKRAIEEIRIHLK